MSLSCQQADITQLIEPKWQEGMQLNVNCQTAKCNIFGAKFKTKELDFSRERASPEEGEGDQTEEQ